MHRAHITLVLLIIVTLLSACSWQHGAPAVLDENLLAAMQQSESVIVAEPQLPLPTLKVYYELKHKPLPGEKLVIELEIKPSADFVACSYAVKVPEAMEILEPSGVMNIGSLKAGGTYHEQIKLRPGHEGMFEIKVYLAAAIAAQEPKIKVVNIPISLGPFQKSRGQPQ